MDGGGGRGSLTSESSRRAILEVIDTNPNVRLSTLCDYLDISSRTIQRWKKDGLTDKRKGAAKSVPKKLTEQEVSQIYGVLCSDEYKEMTPIEAYNTLLDKGIYLASPRSFYRILKRFNALAHRSETKTRSSRSKPAELKAYAKNQVWMWDITWLKSPVTGMFYYAYVIEDLYDRSIVAWMIYDRESDIHSKELFENACRKENAHPKFVQLQ